jgi:hypothetical protein
MKRILLASASVFAFAGAAAAEVSFGGDASLGYNEAVEGGFFYGADLTVSMTQELDNGLTASASGDINFADDDGDTTRSSDQLNTSYVLSLSADMATLSFGDVAPVADDVWSGVSGSAVAGFNDGDVHFDVANFDAILRGDVMYSGVNAHISFGVDTNGNAVGGEEIDAMQLAATASFGGFGIIAAYQEEYNGADSIVGIAGTASLAGADVKVAYETDGTETSIGASVSYPVGPVTVGGYFTSNDIADNSYGVSADYASGPVSISAAFDSDAGTETVEVDVTYDVGNGITALVGAGSDLTNSTTYYYAAGEVDLGGGASFLLSYADDDSAAANDEIGGPEYNQGMTALLSFKF